MSYNSLTISYANSAQTVEDGYWIRLEQADIEEDTATLGEVADLIDEVFELNPCTEPEETEEETATEEQDVTQITEGEVGDVIDLDNAGKPVADFLDQEEFAGIVDDVFKLNICGIDEDGNCSIDIKVWQSHPGEPYALKFDNGEDYKTVIVECEIDEKVAVESASGITLDWPVLSSGTFAWSGSVVDSNGTSGAGPEITRTGNTLNWGKPVTGTLSVKFDSRYDLVSIAVYGDGDGNTQDCRVLGFYHGMVDELDLEIPDPPTDDEIDAQTNYCDRTSQWEVPVEKPLPWWITDRISNYCRCSGEFSHYTYDNEPTQAEFDKDPPEHRFPARYKDINGGFIGCDEHTGDMNNPVFYEQVCCDPPPQGMDLPECSTRHTMSGFVSMDADVLENLQNEYGEVLKIISVEPLNGDCGVTHWNYVSNFRNCCEDVAELSFDLENSIEVLADNSSGLVQVSGGKTPLTWRAVSAGLYLNAARTQKTRVTYGIGAGIIAVYSADICGMVVLSVTDGCSTAALMIRATTGQWVEIPDVTDHADMNLDATSLLSSTEGVYCGLGNVRFEAIDGRYKAQQTYQSTGLAFTKSVYNGPVSCAGVPTDWMDVYDTIEAGHVQPDDEPVLIDRSSVNAVLPDCSYWIYECSGPGYEYTGNGAGYSLYQYTDGLYSKCTTKAYAIIAMGDYPNCSTYPRLWEWRC